MSSVANEEEKKENVVFSQFKMQVMTQRRIRLVFSITTDRTKRMLFFLSILLTLLLSDRSIDLIRLTGQVRFDSACLDSMNEQIRSFLFFSHLFIFIESKRMRERQRWRQLLVLGSDRRSDGSPRLQLDQFISRRWPKSVEKRHKKKTKRKTAKSRIVRRFQ